MPNEKMYEQILAFVQTHMLLITIILIIAVTFAIFAIIGLWKIFEKAGEDGWKCLIPIYNGYIIYKIFWETKYFWIVLGLSFCCGVINNISTQMQSVSLSMIGLLFALATFIFTVLLNYRIAGSFGHGVLYCIGLTFLSGIFYIVLGFSQDEYYEY